MKPCLLIPCFDHGAPLRGVLESLAPYNLPCLVVDDGSAPETQEALARAERELPFVRLHRLARNAGKGVALASGYRLAASQGFTHALQMDADGQHDAAAVPAFLEAMQKDPDALVLGLPVFDESAPRARIWARDRKKVRSRRSCSDDLSGPTARATASAGSIGNSRDPANTASASTLPLPA